MDIDDRVRGYACAAVGGCAAERITAVSRFASGERHAVFKVSYVDPVAGPNDLVVRVSLRDDGVERAQAAREAFVLDKVQGVAAPGLHDFRAESPWFDAPAMCMQFVPGQPRELTAVDPEDVERLGSVVGSVHALPTDDLVALFPGTEPGAAYRDASVAQIAGYMPSVRDPLPVPTQRRFELAVRRINDRVVATRGSGKLRGDRELVLLHGDVVAGNIIWSPTPVLIDWEYARLDDPADEIAYIFSQNGLSTAQRNAFWRGYHRTTDARSSAIEERVAWWEPVTLLGSALWWVERWSRRVDADTAGEIDPTAPRASSYYLDQALARLDRLDDAWG